MRLLASDPDVETLVARIKAGDLDLQPDFQRGEVWGRAKKQRLIDSILRDWHVPPIHVIENPLTKRQEVLDGQQRLTAIRDFVSNQFPISGNSEPLDERITALHGKYYSELDTDIKRVFNRFSIRSFLLVDFNPSEPGELFFRLNQPTSLTSAEQRNAFFGPIRSQIKELIGRLNGSGLNAELLGFSNSRMAYDDVIARIAVVASRGAIDDKVTARDLELLYRRESPLPGVTIDLVERAMSKLFYTLKDFQGSMRMNRAALFSWSIFLMRAEIGLVVPLEYSQFRSFVSTFESLRSNVGRDGLKIHDRISWLAGVFENRASSRVADTSSVVLRDAALWLTYLQFVRETSAILPTVNASLLKLEEMSVRIWETRDIADDNFARRVIESGWPRLNA